MSWETDWISEFETAIAASFGGNVVLPQTDPLTSNFFMAMQAMQLNMLEEAITLMQQFGTQNGARFIVLRYGAYEPEEDLGLANNLYRAPVDLYYIATRSTDSQATVSAAIRAFANSIDFGLGFTHFQSFERASIDSSDQNLPNQVYAAGKIDLVAAVCSWSPGLLVGETNT